MGKVRERTVSLLLRLSVEEKGELQRIAVAYRTSASNVLRLLIRAEHDQMFGSEALRTSPKGQE